MQKQLWADGDTNGRKRTGTYAVIINSESNLTNSRTFCADSKKKQTLRCWSRTRAPKQWPMHTIHYNMYHLNRSIACDIPVHYRYYRLRKKSRLFYDRFIGWLVWLMFVVVFCSFCYFSFILMGFLFVPSR